MWRDSTFTKFIFDTKQRCTKFYKNYAKGKLFGIIINYKLIIILIRFLVLILLLLHHEKDTLMLCHYYCLKELL